MGRGDAALGGAVRVAVLAHLTDGRGDCACGGYLRRLRRAYQLTPLKDRCLARCRSPPGFMLKLGAYRGRTRDLRAGLYHGTFCLACCWALMALLVAFGLMNVIAMVILAGAVLTEKPWARWRTGTSGAPTSRYAIARRSACAAA
jgi:predicted metal-binding membrane protein